MSPALVCAATKGDGVAAPSVRLVAATAAVIVATAWVVSYVPGLRPAFAFTPMLTVNSESLAAELVDGTNYSACGSDIRALASPWAGAAGGGGPAACGTVPDLLRSLASGRRAGADAPFVAGGCAPRWYGPRAACRLLVERDVSILLIGDSLTRHVSQSLFAVLAGNVARGAMAWWRIESAADRAGCSCAGAYTEKVCRHFSAARYFAEASRRVCDGNATADALPRVTTFEWFDAYNAGALREMLATHTRAGRFVVVYVNVGLHYSENPPAGVGPNGALAGMLRVVAEFAPNATAFVVTAHSTGSGRGQGPDGLAALNAELRARAAEAVMPRLSAAGVVAPGPTPVFESVAFTRNATPYDGTHHTLANVPLAVWALNAVDLLSAGRAARRG